jgi:hypothetical protein
VLGQLGNRVQHALRAFTPRDQKAVKSAAQTMRTNPAFDTEKAIGELGTGEALISCLDEKGSPSIVERGFILPPASQIGPITPAQRQSLIAQSLVKGIYDAVQDRESAYEKLKARAAATTTQSQPTRTAAPAATRAPGRRSDTVVEAMTKSVVRTMGSTLGREIIRGVLGSLLGGNRRR